jgi:hypothetical protein
MLMKLELLEFATQNWISRGSSCTARRRGEKKVAINVSAAFLRPIKPLTVMKTLFVPFRSRRNKARRVDGRPGGEMINSNRGNLEIRLEVKKMKFSSCSGSEVTQAALAVEKRLLNYVKASRRELSAM